MNAWPTLCRDCFARSAGAADKAPGRCPACGSPRRLAHPELDALGIAHIDCDAFYASVEKRDDPSLRDKPLIIGGGRRGVVSTACYLARVDGVRSAMPMFKALRACPNAEIRKPDMEKYAAVAREIRDLMESVTPLVEPLSIDEAFLDLTGTERLHRMAPSETLARLAKRIETEIGITVSVGLSHNKFLAKIASDRDKPRGFSVIGVAETRDYLARLPVTAIWGVGAAGAAALKKDGITTIAHLQKADEKTLMARYGKTGLHLARLARGEDARAVSPVRAAKSISSETTFAEDVADPAALDRHLWRLSEKTAARLKEKRLAGRTVVLKLKTAEFKSLTRSRSLAHATQLADEIYRTGAALLKPEAQGRPYRLIGVGVSGLERHTGDQADWLDPGTGKRAVTERAMDAVRAKFGASAIGKGRGLG